MFHVSHSATCGNDIKRDTVYYTQHALHTQVVTRFSASFLLTRIIDSNVRTKICIFTVYNKTDPEMSQNFSTVLRCCFEWEAENMRQIKHEFI